MALKIIAIRTDASLEIGTGHVMRCLTLADTLRLEGAQCYFICREHPGNLIKLIRERGYNVCVLPAVKESITNKENNLVSGADYVSWLGTDLDTDAAQTKDCIGQKIVDWLIVDHYAIESRWEKTLQPLYRKLLVIDDLANRLHVCDLLLDQNYFRDPEQRYIGLIPDYCITFLGPSHVLLRSEFNIARKNLKNRDGTVQRILIFFGGTDPANETTKLLKALKILKRSDIKVDVVVGTANPNQNIVQKMCEELPNVNFYCQVSNMAELILNADLGIGAGGSAMWERCFLGLPTITVVFSDNQIRTTEDVAEFGAIEYLGWANQIKPEDYVSAINRMIQNPLLVEEIASSALKLIPQENRSSLLNMM